MHREGFSRSVAWGETKGGGGIKTRGQILGDGEGKPGGEKKNMGRAGLRDLEPKRS